MVEAGHEDPPMQCAPKRKADAAVASGQQGTWEGCATRRKAGEHAAAASGREGEGESWLDFIVAHKRLSQEEVGFILSQKRKRYASAEQFEAEFGGEGEDFAEFEARQDDYFEFQRWVRSQYEDHGFVGVDDDYIARRVECEALMEEWAEMISAFVFSDDDEDGENAVEKP